MGILSWLRSRGIRKRAIDALQHGRLGEATAAFKEVVSTAQGDWQAWCTLGECQYALGQFDAAQRAFDRCLELNPESVEAAAGRALVWAERDRAWARSINELERILRLTAEAGVPELTELSIAWVYHLQGDTARATDYFDRALDNMSGWESLGLDPDAQFADIEYRIGVLYHSLKSNLDQALEHLRRAAELSPESIFAREAQTRIEEITGPETTG
jgi:tetratricopeptide (TPR) repeat protein